MTATQKEPPSGLVTFLFTDIEGSTRLLGHLEDRYQELLDKHHSVLRDVWNEFEGYEIDSVGDSFLVAFSGAHDAVLAASVAQQELATVRWPTEHAVRVRMGAHTGYARPRSGRYVAMSVHQAARVVNAAHGGQIVISSDTHAALNEDGGAQKHGMSLADLGKFRVRDFSQPVQLFRVQAQGWTDPGLPPRVRPAESHNLTPPANPCLGRDDELNALQQLVGPGRLASLVGAGGIGKTRLAMEFCLRQAPLWPDGVWMVSLDALRSADAIAEALVEACSAPTQPGRSMADDALDHLQNLEALLLLDNCEHLCTDVSELVLRLRQHCPRLGFLATSQMPLQLPAEKVMRLAPLATNRSHSGRDSTSPALALFMNLAYGLEAKEVDAAAQLCEKLEGIPLAIELAAARATSIPPSMILEQLDESLDILRATNPGIPERQRSMDKVLQWSMDLLDVDERRLLQGLALFSGSFGLQAAGALAQAMGSTATRIASAIWTLADHSLIQADTSSGGTRFRMLMSVRNSALEQLAPSERVKFARALGHYYAETFPLEQSYKHRWAGALQGEVVNIRGVIQELARVDDPLGLTLGSAIIAMHARLGGMATGAAEGLLLLKAFSARDQARLGLMSDLARCCEELGALDQALELADAGETLQAEVGLPAYMPFQWAHIRSLVETRRGNMEKALVYLRQALPEAISDRAICQLWNGMGVALVQTGGFTEGLDAFRKAKVAGQRAGMEIAVDTISGNLAELELRAGHLRAAAQNQLETLYSARSLANGRNVAYALIVAARIQAQCEDWPLAVTLVRAGMQLLQQAGCQMYPDDEELVDELLRQATNNISAKVVLAAEAEAKTWTLNDAADHAEAVLGQISKADTLP